MLMLSVLSPDSNTLESALEEVTRGARGASIKDVQSEQLGEFKALRLELAVGEEEPPVVWLVVAPSGRAVGFIPDGDLALVEAVLNTLRSVTL